MSEEKKTTKPQSGKFVPFLVIALIVASFAIGMLFNKVQTLEKEGRNPGIANNQQAAAPQPQQPTSATTSTDGDPVLGDKDAPVTIIEFSDYECPFCKRHFTDTYPELIKEYIDTGKAKLVYRDLALPFHNPLATKQAVAANCAREQGGDSKYFEYHDEIFTRTKSNGNGMAEGELVTIATDLGLDKDKFTSCQSDPKQEEEVEKDIADAGAAGASGTPTFVIGKSTKDGNIEGDLLVGAQPFAAFQAVIDPLLE